MIRSYRSRALKRLHENGDAGGINPQHVRKIQLVLDLLERAAAPEDMNVPGLRFHKLTSENPPRWSVRVSANWRITFSFEETEAVGVDYLDYH